jgi:hypothetical protein
MLFVEVALCLPVAQGGLTSWVIVRRSFGDPSGIVRRGIICTLAVDLLFLGFFGGFLGLFWDFRDFWVFWDFRDFFLGLWGLFLWALGTFSWGFGDFFLGLWGLFLWGLVFYSFFRGVGGGGEPFFWLDCSLFGTGFLSAVCLNPREYLLIKII